MIWTEPCNKYLLNLSLIGHLRSWPSLFLRNNFQTKQYLQISVEVHHNQCPVGEFFAHPGSILLLHGTCPGKVSGSRSGFLWPRRTKSSQFLPIFWQGDGCNHCASESIWGLVRRILERLYPDPGYPHYSEGHWCKIWVFPFHIDSFFRKLI